MRVHDTLEPRRGLRAARRELIETGRIIGDGGYSRVIACNAYSVLKLTSCRQTQQLLDRLHRLDKTRHPRGLPVVLERWGKVAQDADGHEFAGYIIERLYAEDAVAERLRGKRLGGPLLGSRRQLAPSPYPLRLAELKALEDALDAARERCLLGERSAHFEHLEMARQLSQLQLPGGIQSTFEFLAGFLLDSKGDLDLFQRGNILLDCMGRPMLADPVAEQTTEHCGLDAPSETEGGSHALLARAVVALRGLRAEVEWDTVSLSSDPAALEEAAQELLAEPSTTFEVRVLPRGSAEHMKLLSFGRHEVDLWSVPAAARKEALRPR